MPLDPHLAGMLKAAAEAGATPVHKVGPEQGRAQYRFGTFESLPAERFTPVASVDDISIPNDTGGLSARVYRPDGTGPLPTVVFFHGGGWVIGDLDTHDTVCRGIANYTRAVVLSVDYRLAPEHPFPAAADDAVTAARWAAANLSTLGGNSRLGFAGDSAGANLAIVAAETLRLDDVDVSAQLLFYPTVDTNSDDYPSRVENGQGYMLETETMDFFTASYVGDSDTTDSRLSPILSENLAVMPATLVYTAEFDPLRDEGIAYVAALKKAGVRAEVNNLAGMTHGFVSFTHLSPAADGHVKEAYTRFSQFLN